MGSLVRKVPFLFTAAMLAVGTAATRPTEAQVAVAIPQAELDAALALCTQEDACLVALRALVARIAAANPGIPIATVIGSVVASVVAAYNSGAVQATVAAVALSTAATVADANGATDIAAAVSVALAEFEAGDPVDVEAIAEASASPT